MKELFDNESKQALVQYRLERAVKSLEEAEYLIKGGYYNASVNYIMLVTMLLSPCC